MRSRRAVALDPRAREGDDAGDVEQILDRERDAGERSGIAAGGDQGIDGSRLAQGAQLEHIGECVDRPVAFADAGKRLRGHIDGAHLARAYGSRNGVRGLHGGEPG